jgi:REP element-mobilizing transposase RayT
MPRQRRAEVAGASYHIVSRGNNGQPIFDDSLRKLFPLQLDPVCRRFDWTAIAWACMTNHFHLIIQIGQTGLSNGMRHLNTGFALASNARFGRINHCFGERFFSKQIESEEQLFASVRYTLWNPARAGIGGHPVDNDWTSYRATAGLAYQPGALGVASLLRHFGPDPESAREGFRAFVDDGARRCLQPWDGGRGILR